MTDVYKQEETREETITQRDARLKKANETARYEEILGLLSQLNPTTGEVALCGDVAGHEFHGNQYTGRGGGEDREHPSIKDKLAASERARQRGDKTAANAFYEAANSQADMERRQEASDGSDGSRRAQAEGASTSTQHSNARDHHIAKADEAYKAGHDHLGAAHDRAAIEHHKAEKMGSETEQSSVARRASAKAHDLEDKIRSGK